MVGGRRREARLRASGGAPRRGLAPEGPAAPRPARGMAAIICTRALALCKGWLPWFAVAPPPARCARGGRVADGCHHFVFRFSTEKRNLTRFRSRFFNLQGFPCVRDGCHGFPWLPCARIARGSRRGPSGRCRGGVSRPSGLLPPPMAAMIFASGFPQRERWLPWFCDLMPALLFGPSENHGSHKMGH